MATYSTTTNSIPITSDGTTNSITVDPSYITTNGLNTSTSNSVYWEVPKPRSLEIDIDGTGNIVEFSGKELVRLKEMLTEWIEDKHPEDLL